MDLCEYVGFDQANNVEQWRRVSGFELKCMWLLDRVRGEKPARIGYEAWLYAQVADGVLLPVEMLDWLQRIIQG